MSQTSCIEVFKWLQSKPALALMVISTANLLVGCTFIDSLMVSERGKDYCRTHGASTGSSFYDELNYRKCLKTADAMVAEADKNARRTADEHRVMLAAARNPAYIRKWEADKARWDKVLAPDLESCNGMEGIPANRETGSPPVSAEDLEAGCRENRELEAEQRKNLDGGFSAQISSFEGWYQWAIRRNRKWPVREVEDAMRD